MIWEEIFNSRTWGRYPPEELVRVVTKFVRKRNQEKLACIEIGSGPGANALLLSDLFEIAQNSLFNNLRFKTSSLKNYKKYSYDNIKSRYYLRIMTEDKAGVLSSITNLFSKTGISVEKILQLPEKIHTDLPDILSKILEKKPTKYSEILL